MGALMYASQGTFERVDPDDRDLVHGEPPAGGFEFYQATCGSCGCWRRIGIRPDLLEIAAYKLAPVDVFIARGWEVSRKRVRCPFCLGELPRPEGAPVPLPEPPEPELVDLTLEVRP
jgi:hypothetical protein